ncbi:MAG TPA: 4-hydroxy-tetrahydrodipicolinate reductase [Candidatus Baltobacteraceae bacterium]|nr:4-hydroxy-tetrahydrodipicolinate reductase [Candidatus Baltobacteraceae bacterium]
MIRVCVAGATGWAGSAVTRAILTSTDFALSGAIARKRVGEDIGSIVGIAACGVPISATFDDALAKNTDVLIDYTGPESVKMRVMEAVRRGVRVVVGTSGLAADDYADIDLEARRHGTGVVAAGNFSITAALAKHCSLIAAKYLPAWEIIDYADAAKVDAPSGSARELAEALAQVRKSAKAVAVADTVGAKDARGADIAGTQVHSLRLPSFVISFETIFGLPDERLTIRHDSGTGAQPYVAGTLLAVQEVMNLTGVVRGLDQLLFSERASS